MGFTVFLQELVRAGNRIQDRSSHCPPPPSSPCNQQTGYHASSKNAHTPTHTLQQNPLAILFFFLSWLVKWDEPMLDYFQEALCVRLPVCDGIVSSYMHGLHVQMHPRRILYVRISECDRTNRIGLRLLKIFHGVSAQVWRVSRQFQLHNFRAHNPKAYLHLLL